MKKWLVVILLIACMFVFTATIFASFPLDPMKCPICGQMSFFANQTKQNQDGYQMYLFKCVKMHYFWVNGN